MSSNTLYILFIAVPGGVFFSEGMVFGTDLSTFQAVDAVVVLDIFIFRQIDVHRAVIITKAAVGAYFQIPSDQQALEAKQLAHILKQVEQSAIGTEETAEDPFSEQAANNYKQPDY